ncbi:MAG: hypothetical protein Q9O62_03525 [Ardenticatenia bacterium]|nr:hypothetical protein [Ardenticatenia bacterium]
MVVSTAPAVIGNSPDGTNKAFYERVAFVGQVPVKVRGPVRAGDFIVPSGRNDGTGVAVAPERLTLEQVNQVVGQALESASGSGVHKVNVLVGLPPLRITQALLAARDAQLAQQQAQLAALEKRIETLERGGGWARWSAPWLPNIGALALAGVAFWAGRRHRGKEESR